MDKNSYQESPILSALGEAFVFSEIKIQTD